MAAAAVFVRYNSPETKTSAVVKEMREASQAMWDAYLAMRRLVVANPIDKTPLDRESFLIPEPSARTPSTIPEDAPLPVGLIWSPRKAVIEGQGQTTASVNRLGLPNKQKTWLVAKWGFAPQGTDPATVSLVETKVIGRSRLTIELEADKAGMVLFIQMAYRSNAGRGPWSRIVQLNVV